MLATAFSLFCLQRRPFAYFTFPRWQSILAIMLIGVLMGLDPSFRSVAPHTSLGIFAQPLWAVVGINVFMAWLGFLVVLGVLRWWMKRGQRWDGEGDLFNVLAASWLVVDVLGTGLVALGVPQLWTLPLWLYSLWISANAFSGAMPKVSTGYAIQGIVLSFVPAMFVISIAFGLLSFAMAILTGAPPVAR